MGNIVGEPFRNYVSSQITTRQKIHGKGINKWRTPDEISFLNSQNAFVKLASSVSLTQDRLDLITKEYGNLMAKGVPPGKALAMKYVLFNGVTSMGNTKGMSKAPRSDDSSREFLDFAKEKEIESFQQTQRQGFFSENGSYSNDKSLGGTNFGIVPMPGIISVDSKDLNRGSIKRSQVKIKAYNRQQFDIIDVLYLRLGYTVLLEWGHNIYFDDSTTPPKLKQQRSTLTDEIFFSEDENYEFLLSEIKKLREKKRGNYDAILGKIVNFSWTFANDGTYDITLDIISLGDVIESLKVNLPPIGALDDFYSYYDRQAIRQQFKQSQAQSINDLYLIYPTLQNILKDWWDSFSNNSDVMVKYVPATDNDILTDVDQGYGCNYFSNADFDYRMSQGGPADRWGCMSIPLSQQILNSEQETLARTNITKNLEDAMKYALIFIMNGSYGGQHFTDSYNHRQGGQSDGNDPNIIKGFQNGVGIYLDNDVEWSNKNIGGTANNGGPRRGIFTVNNKRQGNAILPDASSPWDTIIIGTTSTGKPFGVEFTGWGGGTDAYNKTIRSLLFTQVAFDQDAVRVRLSNNITQFDFFNIDPTSTTNILNGLTINFTPSKGIVTNRLVQLQAQKILYLNIEYRGGFSEFEKRILQWFQWANAAGGQQDNQFKNQPAFVSYSQELEYERNKNRIFEWFYQVRKHDTGNVNSLGQQTQAGATKYFGGVAVNTDIKIGKILNPSGFNPNRTYTQMRSLSKEWNDRVMFPQYPRRRIRNVPGQSFQDYEVYDSKDFFVLSGVDFKMNLEPRYRYFVKLGTLLDFVEEKIIPTIVPNITNSSSDKISLIKIDTDTSSNICYALDNTFSSDIRSCIVRNDKYYAGEDQNGSIFYKMFDGGGVGTGIDHFLVPRSDGYIYGRIMNVYMNFEFIQTILDTLVGEDGETILFDFLKKICNEINKCLGYVNNLEPVIDSETNTIKIIDQTPIPGITSIMGDLKDDWGDLYNPDFVPTNEAIFEVFGYNPDKKNISNFVHNIGLQTKISKRFASMITIGATAQGGIPGFEATAFSKWNTGIIDRVKPEIVDGASRKLRDVKTQNQRVIEAYLKYLQIKNVDERLKLIGLTKNGAINPMYIETNPSVISSYYKYAQVESSRSGSLESSVGFLPFDLQIDMDGLSGMKIYNRVKINTRFLPSNYPKTLEFIVTNVNHKLETQKWTTSLHTQATSIISADSGSVINTPELIQAESKNITRINQQNISRLVVTDQNPSRFIDFDSQSSHKFNPATYSKEIDINTLLKRLHPDVQSRWKVFLERIINETTGFDYQVQSTFRSFSRSAMFYRKRYDSSYTGTNIDSTAYPGQSPHNYGMALDIGVKDRGANFTYGNLNPGEGDLNRYLALPIVQIANEENFDWGGTFQGYFDPVHYNPSFNKTQTKKNLANAFGFSKSKWATLKSQGKWDELFELAQTIDLKAAVEGGIQFNNLSNYFDVTKASNSGDIMKRFTDNSIFQYMLDGIYKNVRIVF